MYTKEDIKDYKDIAREEKATRIRIDIIEWWSREHGNGNQTELLNNLLRALGMKVVLVPYLVRAYYMENQVQEIVVDAMGEEHARRQVCESILIDDEPCVLRIPTRYIGAGFALSGRHSSFEIDAASLIHDDAWTYEVTRYYEEVSA